MIKKFLDYLYYIFEILSNYIPFFAELYIKYHSPSVKKEIEMSRLSQSDKVLHIGCGAIPYTSIVIAREINTDIVGIDHKLRIVNIATDYIKRYSLSDVVRIERGNGKTYDVSNFDVIIISYGVVDQNLVLKHVLESMNGGARIILRRSTEDKNGYIDPIVNEFSVSSIRLLLTQESVLIVKENQKL